MYEILRKLSHELERMDKSIASHQETIERLSHYVEKIVKCNAPGSELSSNVPTAMLHFPATNLDAYSWEDIDRIAKAGAAQRQFALGATKNIKLTDGTIICVRIIGFNHDCAETPARLPITFETVETLNKPLSMHETVTDTYTWGNSSVRHYLNDYVFNDLLPSDLKVFIKPCVKWTHTRDGDEGYFHQTVDKLFILSEQELYGRAFYSGGKEGSWYDWYKQEHISYVKCKQNGERNWRWLRSPYSGYSNGFCNVNSDGTAHISNANYSSGVSFGFCI